MRKGKYRVVFISFQQNMPGRDKVYPFITEALLNGTYPNLLWTDPSRSFSITFQRLGSSFVPEMDKILEDYDRIGGHTYDHSTSRQRLRNALKKSDNFKFVEKNGMNDIFYILTQEERKIKKKQKEKKKKLRSDYTSDAETSAETSPSQPSVAENFTEFQRRDHCPNFDDIFELSDFKEFLKGKGDGISQGSEDEVGGFSAVV